jgi:quercetin dioxygenase-like cupin family protein
MASLIDRGLTRRFVRAGTCMENSVYLIERGTMRQETKPKGLGTGVAKIAELVDYQEGSIVSREIVRKPTGTVTIFAFDEGQGLSEHTAPFDALVHVVEGEVEITIAGKAYRLQADEMILLPAKQPHALKALQRCKMVLTMIRS